jgi:hypothetical protein
LPAEWLCSGAASGGRNDAQRWEWGVNDAHIASRTLNGSNPAAKLASGNIKGKWIVFHFPSVTEKLGRRLHRH